MVVMINQWKFDIINNSFTVNSAVDTNTQSGTFKTEYFQLFWIVQEFKLPDSDDQRTL